MTQIEITTRIATPRDVTVVDTLMGRVYPKLLRGDYPDALLNDVSRYLGHAQPGLVGAGQFFLIEERGRLLAAGGWSRNAPRGHLGPPEIGHMRHLATDPDHCRRGIGRRLAAQIMAHAKAAGIKAMHCNATLTAVPFYRALGFRQLAEIDLRLRPGLFLPAVHMMIEL